MATHLTCAEIFDDDLLQIVTAKSTLKEICINWSTYDHVSGKKVAGLSRFVSCCIRDEGLVRAVIRRTSTVIIAANCGVPLI